MDEEFTYTLCNKICNYSITSVCLKSKACKFYLTIWGLLMKYRVNDHSSSILSKLLMTLQSAVRSSVIFLSLLEISNLNFFYASHVILQALPITLNSSVSTLHFWGRPERTQYSQIQGSPWHKGAVMFYDLIPMPFPIIAKTVGVWH